MEELRVLSPTAILGYGFPIESFREGMRREPHVIAIDAGSTDPGPFYLGAGISFTDRNAVKRDLEIILTAAIEHKIPVIIGSALPFSLSVSIAHCIRLLCKSIGVSITESMNALVSGNLSN
jgi:hypothetical protein